MVTSQVCQLTERTHVLIITLEIAQVSHHRKLSFWTLDQLYGLDLLAMNVLEL